MKFYIEVTRFGWKVEEVSSESKQSTLAASGYYSEIGEFNNKNKAEDVARIIYKSFTEKQP